MRTKAKVIRTEGNVAWVRVCHGEYCAGCGLHSADEKLIDVAVRNVLKVNAGDRVEVSSDEGRMVRTMFLVFWFPLAMAGILAWIGYQAGTRLAWREPSVLSIALGVVGLALALLAVYRVGKNTKAGTGLTISRVILDGEPTCSSGLPLEGNPPIP